MKKIGLAVLATAVVLTGCSTKKEEAKKEETVQVDLNKEAGNYKKFVEEQIDKLLQDTEKFAMTLKEGKLEEAKKQYPIIRMAYERSEPIAESFSELDEKIDFRLVDYKEEHKTEDGWKGFHKIEQILWTKNTTKGTEMYADDLVKDIKELKAKIPTVEVTPDLMLTGATDLLNEVATQKITGEEEVFSHTDLYDFRANIEGAQKIYEIFKPALDKKDAKISSTIKENFDAVNKLLDKHMTDKENYKLYTALSKEDTKELSEAVTKLGEALSQMAVVVEKKEEKKEDKK